MKALKKSILITFASLSVFFVFNSCNGVPNSTSKNDSTSTGGIKEQDNNHSGGAGDSAKTKPTDSSRIVHGGEMKNGQHVKKTDSVKK